MPSPYEFSIAQPPSDEVLDRQTDEQLVKNYAVTGWSVYELDDAQYQAILKKALGAGNFHLGNWEEGRPVTINGEELISIKKAGSHVMLLLPPHPHT